MSWICENCEAENPDTMFFCEVCDSFREDIISKKLQSFIDGEFTQNEPESFIWYKKAVFYEREISNYFSVITKYDKRTYKDIIMIAPYLLISADKGNHKSQFRIGDLFLGHWRPECRENAFMWFARAANQGYGDAMEKLAFCYEYGIGTEKDLYEAKKWYERAFYKGCDIAKQGLERLQTLL